MLLAGLRGGECSEDLMVLPLPPQRASASLLPFHSLAEQGLGSLALGPWHMSTGLSTLVMVFFFFLQKFKILMINLSVFSFVAYPYVSYPRSRCQMQRREGFPVFSSKNFIVLALMFRFLSHFELIFVYGEGKGSSSYLCM